MIPDCVTASPGKALLLSNGIVLQNLKARGRHGYLAFVYLLSQFEANKELTSLRVQAQILGLHKSDRHDGIPNLTSHHHLRQTEAMGRASTLH